MEPAGNRSEWISRTKLSTGSRDVLQLELEVGQSVQIDSVMVTVVEIQGDEICLKIDDEADSMFPIRLSELLPRVPK